MARAATPALPTYFVGRDGKSILCLGCGRRSTDANDVRYKFCGNCGWHNIPLAATPTEAAAAFMARAVRNLEFESGVLLEALQLAQKALAIVESQLVVTAMSVEETVRD